MRGARRVYRLAARLLLPGLWAESGVEMEDAAMDWLVRAREERGVIGVAGAWAGILVDILATALAARRARGSMQAVTPPAGRGERNGRQGVGEAMMDTVMKDLRYTLRTLVRQPGFTLVTIVTLALGIGANTAVFSVLNGVILRPLGYPQPEQLVFISSRFPTLDFDQFWISPPEFVEFRDHNEAFESVGAFSVGTVTLGATPPSRPVGAVVSHDLLSTLGLSPMVGRPFEEADTRPGAAPVALVSWGLWQREFGGEGDVVGRSILINNTANTVVGILPRGADLPDEGVEIWQPLTIDPATLPNRRGSHFLYLIGRLKPGVTFAAAETDVKRQVAGWRDLVPNGHVPSDPNHPLRIDPLKEQIVGSVRTALLVLQGAVAFVLLIACANLANLLIARADTRSREYAVRTALGASRLRLFRQLLTEGLVLAVAAAVAGLGLAWAGLAALLSVNPDAIPRAADITLDWTVLGFSLAVAVGTALVFGLVPLAHLAKDRVGQALKDSAGRSAAGSVRTRMRSMLVVAEVGLAVLLVVGAGLLIRSFVNLMQVDLGFDRSELTTFSVVLPGSAYDAERRVAFFERLKAAVTDVPGIESVALMSGLPPSRRVDANDTDFEHIPPGRPPGSEPAENTDYWQGVSLGFEQALGMRIIEGRSFESTDVVGAPVVLVNDTLARRFFTDRSPIGQRLKPGFGDTVPWFTIVGIVKDIKLGGVDMGAGTQVYLLNEQLPRTVGFSYGQMSVIARSRLSTGTLAPSLRRVVTELDASLPVIDLRSMDDVVNASVARPRFLTVLLGIFAGLALVLAAVGTYGILSYLVTERRQEIGIRMALGADSGAVLRMILTKGLMLSGAGLVLGLAASIGLTRLLASLLFGVTPTDPVTLAGVAALIAAVAATACLIPAWRATRVNPISVLRN